MHPFADAYANAGFPLPTLLDSYTSPPSSGASQQPAQPVSPPHNGAIAAGPQQLSHGAHDASYAWPEGLSFDDSHFGFDAASSSSHTPLGSFGAPNIDFGSSSSMTHPTPFSFAQTSSRPPLTPTSFPEPYHAPPSLWDPQSHTPAASSTYTGTHPTPRSTSSSTAPSPMPPPQLPMARSNRLKPPVMYPDESFTPPVTLLPPADGSAFAYDGTRPQDSRSRASPELSSPAPRPRSTTRLRRAKSFSAPNVSSALISDERRDDDTGQKLDKLFDLLDEAGWSVGEMLHALSDTPKDSLGRDIRTREHRERMEAFLTKAETPSELVQQETRRGARARRAAEPAGLMKMWNDARNATERNLETTVANLYSGTGESHVLAIRNILTRDGVPYEESPSDIQMLDATLSRPPSPRSFSASATSTQTRDPQPYTGRLVIPSIQANILGKWLMSPGRPALADEKDSIKPEHMRIYSSLNPIELHARGAELCRAVLMRDVSLSMEHWHHVDTLESFIEGPNIAPSTRCNFHSYPDYDLWHHCLLTYLQLCTRYPSFRDSPPSSSLAPKPFALTLAPDLSSLAATSPNLELEARLVERALQVHWDALRLHLLEEGGLLRRAVKAFAADRASGNKGRIRPLDLMLICDDTQVVLKALKKSLTHPSERILPYDPLISHQRNAWRQAAFWSADSHLLGWQAATSQFLEISAMFPKFSEGVRELPALEKLLSGRDHGGGGGGGR